MPLSYELISQFAKLASGEKKTVAEATVYGTVMVDAKGNKYVKLDGSDQLTPLADDEQPSVDSTSVNVNDGERVSVLIKNHTATVTGNISSPAARTGDVEKLDEAVTKIQEFDILIGEKVQANESYFKKLLADEATLGKLVASAVSIADLIAKKAEIEALIADKLTVTDLIAKKIDTDVVVADQALIENLKSTNVDVLSLLAEKAVIEDLIANKGNIKKLISDEADLKYANIDFANIGEAAIEEFYAKSGIINSIVIEEGVVVRELVGVTIKGDLIEGGTVKADKLVVKGSDGLFYKLNFESGNFVDGEEVPEDQLHGSVIAAKSITAEKVNVDDLVAFGATIGGFKIKDGALYSGVKESIENTTTGIYMDAEGQIHVGDSSNHIKYHKVVDPETNEESYKLDIVTDDVTIRGKNAVDILDCITIDPDNNTISLGAGKTKMSLVLQNDVVSFHKDGEQFGWWDGVDFHTGNIVIKVTERAQFGNFAMVPRTDGSLSFLKVQ